jgi:uncharacterized protein YcfJ
MRQVIRPVVAFATVIGAAFVGSAAFAAEYATVVSSTPVTAQVAVPRQQCTDSEQYVQQSPTGAGAVIGAIAGGVLGNAVGGGFGRAAATGIGVVAGSVVGNQVEANSNPVTAVPVRRCQTVMTYENRVVGYDVMYDYGGQRYSARMARDPGKQFAVDVRPAGEAAAAPLPAPVYADGTAPPQGYYDPQPVYGTPYYSPYYSPYYAPSPVVYAAPVIGLGLGFGYYDGWRGRRWR